MKIIVTGCKGQLGTEIIKQLREGRSEIGPIPEKLMNATVIPVDLPELDISNYKMVDDFIRRQRPDVIINCTGFNDEDGCETDPDRAYRVNALAPRNLALAADALGRAKDIAPEVAFIHAREKDCHVLLDLLAAGEIPLRVTHNDTKINNVLIDAATGKGICVIDLDTVMPGLSAYDFGDSIRTGANDCAEDESDQSKVHFDLHLYEVFAKGYLSTAGASMSPAEKKSLAWGAKLMTLECGIRFLTDYLEGDHYFHTARPGHNLDRARTQFTLVRQMEEVFGQMLEIVS